MTRLCLAPACRRLAAAGSYCVGHAHIGMARQREAWDRAKRSDASASYHRWYQSSEWKRRRSAHLKAFPACALCGSTARVEVHHLIPHKGSWSLFMQSPLQTLCPSHHASATSREPKGVGGV